jgi:hypothetical protein
MISSRDDELMKMVFGVKHSGLMSDADLAEALKTEALSSPGFDQWIEKARNMLRAGPRP